MTTLIEYVTSSLSSLKTVLEGVLVTDHNPKYDVKIMMREPDRNDRFPMASITPVEIIPEYMDRSELLENGILTTNILLVTKNPYDDDGTTLLSDLDLVMVALFGVRHDKTKWLKLDYNTGVRIGVTDVVDNWIYQSAEITVSIKVN